MLVVFCWQAAAFYKGGSMTSRAIPLCITAVHVADQRGRTVVEMKPIRMQVAFAPPACTLTTDAERGNPMASTSIPKLCTDVTRSPNRFSARAFECALALLQDFPERLTVPQRIECHIALIAGPDTASLGAISLACSVMGGRQ